MEEPAPELDDARRSAVSRPRPPPQAAADRPGARDGAIAGESTRDWFDRVRDLALGLSSLGVGMGDRVVIMSESRPEWLTADFAILTLGGVTVPVYATLTPAQARYIIQDAGARVAFVSTAEQLEKLQRVRHQLPSLEAIVTFAPLAGRSPSVLSLDALVARGHARLMGEWGVGRQFRDKTREIRPEQLATIIYTSGTTGEPKGVMLSHANLISNLHRRPHHRPRHRGRRVAVVPAVEPFVRAARVVRLPRARRDDRVRGVDGDGRPRPADRSVRR